jgi:hypothetical protein
MPTAMKTTICTIMFLCILHLNSLFAGGDKHFTTRSEPARMELSVSIDRLTPMTPAVAEFSDVSDVPPCMEIPTARFAPVAPKDAEFEDFSVVQETLLMQAVTLSLVAPATPSEADFSE